MKTRDKILYSARHLFNARGEQNISASELATELGMSPGNLYYHFKGKDSIHLALFTELQRSLVGLLGAPLQEPTLFSDDSEDSPILRCWLFLTVVLEQMLEYRYLYANPNDLMHRYPEIERGMRRLTSLKVAACSSIARELLGWPSHDRRLRSLSQAMTLTLTYWLSYEQLSHPADSDSVIVHRGVLQLMSYCAPYLGDDQQGFYSECENIYSSMIDAPS